MTATSIAYTYHLRSWAALLLVFAVFALALWRARGGRSLRRMVDELADRLDQTFGP